MWEEFSPLLYLVGDSKRGGKNRKRERDDKKMGFFFFFKLRGVRHKFVHQTLIEFEGGKLFAWIGRYLLHKRNAPLTFLACVLSLI